MSWLVFLVMKKGNLFISYLKKSNTITVKYNEHPLGWLEKKNPQTRHELQKKVKSYTRKMPQSWIAKEIKSSSIRRWNPTLDKCHKELLAMGKLSNSMYETLKHPTSSQNLASSLWLVSILYLNKFLTGKHFKSQEKMIAEVDWAIH